MHSVTSAAAPKVYPALLLMLQCASLSVCRFEMCKVCLGSVSQGAKGWRADRKCGAKLNDALASRARPAPRSNRISCHMLELHSCCR